MAHALAVRTGAEIILVDSMKVYREMDIGTAKPSPARRAEVPYHLFDLVDPSQDFSVGEYLPLALSTVEEVESRGRPVVLCGGTALYVSALLEGLFQGPEADWELRRSLLREAASTGLEALYRRLEEADPAAAAKIHPHDERRIIRALEVRLLTGRRMTDLWRGSAPRLEPASYRLFGLWWERPALYRRIDQRVPRMVREGLFEEARRLRDRPGGLGRTAAQCIGYQEILQGERQGIGEPETIAAIQQRTRRFAKQQLTWFRRFPIRWFPAEESTRPEEVVDWILAESISASR